MSTGIISTGVSGLNAAQFGLQTTEHNIANANTPGFTRQRTIQATTPGLQTGSGFVGQGTQIATIERIYSSFLTDQVNRSQSSASGLDAYAAQIAQIDGMLADPTTGLSPALQDFFTSVQQVAANPSQLPSRQAMTAAAQALVDRYQSMGNQLKQMSDGIDNEIRSTVAGINSYAEQIASLNQKIGIAEAATGQPANDLLDSRDQLLAQLNKLIKATTTNNSDGSINVFVGSGQQLVVGAQAMSFASVPSASDPSRVAVALKTGAGAAQEIPEALLSGGSLGGLLAFRTESLDQARNELGRNAVSLALTFNAQSALGQDLLGQSQLSAVPSGFSPDLFSISAPTVVPNGRNPAGSPSVSAAFVTPPPYSGNFYTDLGASDYRLTSDGSSVTLTRLSDNQKWTVAGTDPMALNAQAATQGFTLGSATLLAGSSYLIQPSRDAARDISLNPALASDPRLITAAGPVRTAPGAANTGGATISAGNAGPGYAAAVAAMPLTLRYQNGRLQGFAVGALVSLDGGTPFPVDSSGSVAYTSGATITLVGSVASAPPTGFSFAISGLPNNGDTFRITPNTAGTADGRNALALGQLQTEDTMSGKTASFQQAYAQLVSETGNKARQVQVSGDAQKSLLAHAQSSRDSLSGVNLDEEAANLLRYQQAYQASAKALQIGASLFDTILQIAAR